MTTNVFRAPRTDKDLVLRTATAKYDGSPCKKCGGVMRYKSGGACVSCVSARANPTLYFDSKKSLEFRIKTAQILGEAW